MERNTSRVAAVLALLLAGAFTCKAQRDYPDQSLDLIRFLANKPWAGRGHNRWDRGPSFDMDLTERFDPKELWGIKPRIILAPPDVDVSRNEIGDEMNRKYTTMATEDTAEAPKNWAGSMKRSALATALNGRRRRQPTSSPPGKAVTPYVGVGVINFVDSFFDSISGHLDRLAALSPQQRAAMFPKTPSVILAPPAGVSGSTGGGGIGTRRMHSLRPVRPFGNIRTYNRRSFVETGGTYPGANNHNPGLLWTGLGR